MGHPQHSLCQSHSTSRRRLGCRMCLRRGCHRIYQARRWNQRYCQDPDCQKLVRRWQAAKRQQQRRQQPEVRQSHAAHEKQRRARRRATVSSESPPAGDAEAFPDKPPRQGRGAWSRSKNFSAPFCDRPGCHDEVRPSVRCPARYCSDDCRQAIQRVRDRERKWLNRNRPAGRFRAGQHDRARCRARDSWSPAHPR